MPRPINPATPIYQKLFNAYRDDILSHRLQPGQQIDSINQMLAKHGIARETAKRVLNMLADEGYIIQRRGRGSFVSDRRPKARIWGFVFPFYSIQYEDLILHVTNRAAELGREIRHFCNYNSWEEEIRLVGIMLHERYEAVVVIPTMDESKTWDFYSHLSPHDSPVVLLDHTMSSNNFRSVVQTYDLGVTRAIHHLISQKGGSVAFVENEVWSGRNMVMVLTTFDGASANVRRLAASQVLVVRVPSCTSWSSRLPVASYVYVVVPPKSSLVTSWLASS